MWKALQGEETFFLSYDSRRVWGEVARGLQARPQTGNALETLSQRRASSPASRTVNPSDGAGQSCRCVRPQEACVKCDYPWPTELPLCPKDSE